MASNSGALASSDGRTRRLARAQPRVSIFFFSFVLGVFLLEQREQHASSPSCVTGRWLLVCVSPVRCSVWIGVTSDFVAVDEIHRYIHWIRREGNHDER